MEETILEAVLYPRVSSEDQQERETIKTQIDFYNKYCALYGITSLGIYPDDGVSGMIPLPDRPEGKRLVEDAKAGKFKLVLIYNIKRLGRSARNILNAVYDLEQYGVKIRSMTEPFDTSTPTGRFVLTVLAGVADLDRENFLIDTWNGSNRVAGEGKWLGGIIPYGYYVDDKGYPQINERPIPGQDLSEANVVYMMYDLVYSRRMSTIKVADYLNDLGIPTSYAIPNRKKRKTKTAGIWRPSRILAILKNQMYKGEHDYGKRSKKDRELINRKVPAIVSEEMWDQVQLILKDNQIMSSKNAKTNYLLRSLIKCSCCGLTYHGTYFGGPQGKPKHYYVCGGKTAYRGPSQGKCTSKNVPKLWVENMVWNDCLSFINNPGEAINELAAGMEISKNEVNKFESEISLVQKAINEKENEKQAILDLFRKRVINAKDVEAQLTKITDEKFSLETRRKELEEAKDNEVSLATKFQNANDLLTELRGRIHDDMSFEEKRDIVRTLVKKITVETIIDDNGRPQANVYAEYMFSKGVNHTGRDSRRPPA